MSVRETSPPPLVCSAWISKIRSQHSPSWLPFLNSHLLVSVWKENLRIYGSEKVPASLIRTNSYSRPWRRSNEVFASESSTVRKTQCSHQQHPVGALSSTLHNTLTLNTQKLPEIVKQRILTSMHTQTHTHTQNTHTQKQRQKHTWE